MSYIMVASLMPVSAQQIMISVELYMLDIFVFNSMMSACFDAVEKVIILVFNVLQ